MKLSPTRKELEEKGVKMKREDAAPGQIFEAYALYKGDGPYAESTLVGVFFDGAHVSEVWLMENRSCPADVIPVDAVMAIGGHAYVIGERGLFVRTPEIRRGALAKLPEEGK